VSPRSIPQCHCRNENLNYLLSLQYKENKGKFAASNGHVKAKSFSASRGLRPLTRGSAPGPRWGLRPQTPVISSRSRARHVLAPQTSQPNYARACGTTNGLRPHRPLGADTIRDHAAAVVYGMVTACMDHEGRSHLHVATQCVKPRPHQQQCRSNIVECYKVESCSDKSNVALTLLLVWTGFYRNAGCLLRRMQ